MRRVGTRLLSSVPVLLSSVLGGCYAHHTADEELLEIGFPDEVYPDSGAPVADAGTGNQCTQTDPIQFLLCQVTQGGGGGFQIPGLGGGGRDAGSSQTPGLGDLQDIIDLISGGGTGGTGGTGGIQDIIDLLGGLGGQNGGGGTQQPSIEDILGQFFPRRDAGTPQQPSTGGQVTEAQCATATEPVTRFRCAIAGFATPAQGRRDGGTGFTWPFPTQNQGDAGAGIPDTLL